jgi:Tfp pilus assembly protein PilZ
MAMIRYTPVRYEPMFGRYEAAPRQSAMAGANLVAWVEPFRYNGSQEGAAIRFLDGETRHVAETVEQILAQILAQLEDVERRENP